MPKIEQYLKDYPNGEFSPQGWLTDSVITSWGNRSISGKLFEESGEVDKYYKKHLLTMLGMTNESCIFIQDIWFNYYINGQYQEPHDHMNPSYDIIDSHFSAVHFLQFDKSVHKPLEFIDPNSKLNRRHMVNDRYAPHIEEGDIIIFPSHLTHFVTPSEPTPDYPRITVALNFNIREERNDQLY